MTVDKKDVITIPKWLVIWLLPMLVSGVVAFGVVSEIKAQLQIKAERNEKEIERLQDQKVDRYEFNQLINTLHSIERKLDMHIELNNKTDKTYENIKNNY